MKQPLTSTFLTLALTAAALPACDGGPPASATDLGGRWITANGNLEVEIGPCESALCGTVTQVLANHSMSDPGAQMKPADGKDPLGMKILSSFVPSSGGKWAGSIYNRENGKTYDCLLSLKSADELEVRGYVALSLFGKTQIWTRVTERAAR